MTLHWIIPGLLGPTGNHTTQGAEAPRFPSLERLLGRADLSAGPIDVASVLFELFGVPNEPGSIATAPLCYLADTGHLPDNWIAHADPVHLRADQDRLLMFAGRDLSVEDADARSLTTRLNTHFREDGLRFESPSSDHWYVHADKAPSVAFSALDEVSGRNIYAYLPQGRDHGIWRRYLNEIQMLFHDFDSNQAREARGSLAINGVWFSGGGIAPTQSAPKIQTATGKGPLLRGLCALTRVSYREDGALTVDRTTGDQLRLELEPQWAVINADNLAWRKAVERIEAALNGSSSISHLRVYTCDGRVFDYRSNMRLRVWRKSRPLPAWQCESIE